MTDSIISFSCSCGAKLKAPVSKSGRSFSCPKCSSPVTVPAQVSDFSDIARQFPITTPPPLLPKRASGKSIWKIAPIVAGVVMGVIVWSTFLYKKAGPHGVANVKPETEVIAEAKQVPASTVKKEVVPESPMSVAGTPKPVKVKSEVNLPMAEKAEPQVKPSPPIATPKKAESPYEFKGDQLGMSYDDFKRKHYRTFDAGEPYEVPFVSTKRSVEERKRNPISTLGEEPWHPDANIIGATVTYPFEDFKDSPHTPTLAKIPAKLHLYSFIDEKLYKITFLLPHDGYQAVKEAMIYTYKEPSRSESQELQNRFGATFRGDQLLWDNGVSQILLTERLGNIDTSAVIFLHTELDALRKKRESELLKPEL